MTNSSKSSCGDCRFFEPLETKKEDEDFGQCRRNAPMWLADLYLIRQVLLKASAGKMDDYANAELQTAFGPSFPFVSAADWCGEFKEKN